MRIASRVAYSLHAGDIDIFRRREHSGILGNLVIVKREISFGLPPRVEHQHRHGAMGAVMVDGPLREDDVGLFGGKEAREAIVVRRIDNGLPVDLVGERGAGFQDLAGILRFGGADARTTVEARGAAESLAAIEIEQNDLVAQRRVAGDGAGTAAFRIARMSAGDDDLQRFRGSLREQGRGGAREETAAREEHGAIVIRRRVASVGQFRRERAEDLFGDGTEFRCTMPEQTTPPLTPKGIA